MKLHKKGMETRYRHSVIYQHSHNVTLISQHVWVSILSSFQICIFTCVPHTVSGTSEQRPRQGTSLLAFLERLALVRRLCANTPNSMFSVLYYY